MGPVIIIAFGLILFAALIFVNIYFSKKARVKRKLRNAPVRNIRYFSEGEQAKIIGKVEIVDAPIFSPLSGRACAYYRILVEQRTSSGKSSHWQTIIDEENSCRFVIKDGAYHAYINDKNLVSYIVQDMKYSSGFRKDATDVLESYLNAHGYKSENFLGFNKTIRYSEGILEPGEEIAAYGKGEWRYAAQLQLPETYDRILVLSAAGKEKVYLSDDPDTLKSNNPELNRDFLRH